MMYFVFSKIKEILLFRQRMIWSYYRQNLKVAFHFLYIFSNDSLQYNIHTLFFLISNPLILNQLKLFNVSFLYLLQAEFILLGLCPSCTKIWKAEEQASSLGSLDSFSLNFIFLLFMFVFLSKVFTFVIHELNNLYMHI